MQKVRFYYMDAMRSVMMMLGIFAHTSYIFHPHREWKVNSERTMEVIGWLSSSLLAFRMQAFFVISGFFCALMLYRYAPWKFLKARLMRIALPMIVVGATLNLLQSYILGKFGLVDFSLRWHFLEGNWVSHLWFLRNLTVYFIVAAAVMWLIQNHKTAVNNFFIRLTEKINIHIIMLLLPLAFVGILISNQFGFPLYGRWLYDSFKMYQIMQYVPYFLVGILFYTIPPFLDRFCNINIWVVIATVVVAGTALQPTVDATPIPMRIAYEYLYSLVGWCGVCLTFKLFRKYCNTPSKLWTFMSDASYSVYIFHHLLVIIFGYIAVVNGTHPLLATVIIIPLVLAITLLNHKFIIRKLPWRVL